MVPEFIESLREKDLRTAGFLCNNVMISSELENPQNRSRVNW